MVEPKPQDAEGQVRLLLALCDRLGWSDALTASRKLLARAEELRAVVGQGQAEARQYRGEGLRELVSGQYPVALSRVVEIAAKTDPWLDADADIDRGRVTLARAVDVAMEASRICRGQAAAVAVGESPVLYQRAQKAAAECVKQVAKLPKLSRKVWGAPDPALEAVRDGVEVTWAAMLRAQEQFGLLHQFGGVLRRSGGLGASVLLPDGAPDLAYAYRRWDLALDAERELKVLQPALRLRSAVDRGWQPGLYLAGDLVMPAPDPGARRGLFGFLIPSPLRRDGEPVEVA